MTFDRKQLELQDERTAQARYRRKVQERARRHVTHQGPRNNFWTGTGLPDSSIMPYGALVGRVALRQPHDELLAGHRDFYIGETYANLDGIDVYSWAAPVACAFFRGSRHHEFCDQVAVIRAFEHRDDDIFDFHDEPLCDDVPADPFRKRALAVPAAPRRPNVPRLPVPPKTVSQPATPPSHADSCAEKRVTAQQAMPEPSSVMRYQRSAPPAGQGRNPAPPLRAEALLRARLAAPRGVSLAPVLATLQPGQYDLVIAPPMASMIIEGQPGTGKTIIASHRAAYLVSEDIPAENGLNGDVLIVGPTRAYSRHILSVIDRLTGGSERVRVLSLPELMLNILGMKHELRGAISRTWQNVDQELATFVRAALTRLKSTGTRPTCDEVYEHLRQNGTSGYPLTRDLEWASFLRRLPPAQEALEMRTHTPLLATIQWEVAKPSDLLGIEHIIVDEAQDVTPLEWLLLASMNEAHAWTLIGDLNQRRSDHTLAAWAQVLALLAIPQVDPPIHRLQRGYRSTRPILEYANRLLPAAERAVHAFQGEGPEPTVERCRQSQLGAAVLRHLARLQDTYPQGTFAVITADPKGMETMLRREGWAKSRDDQFTWQCAGREAIVAHPDTARGLEFDGVVVVEPSDFPQNLGRQGPLYTALTRPNRELAVVHTKSLPERLGRGRR